MMPEQTSRSTQDIPKPVSVMLVDDHPVVREGLAAIIRRLPGFSVECTADNAEQALEAIGKANINLALLDLELPGMSGLELVRRIKELQPAMPVLVLSAYQENLYAERCVKAGARGYLMKDKAPEKILEAMETVLQGGIYMSEEMKSQMLNRIAGVNGGATVASLTDRELEVFTLIGKGMGSRRIAETLAVSVKTVEAHFANIKRKLSLEDSAALSHRAVQWFESKRFE